MSDKCHKSCTVPLAIAYPFAVKKGYRAVPTKDSSFRYSMPIFKRHILDNWIGDQLSSDRKTYVIQNLASRIQQKLQSKEIDYRLPKHKITIYIPGLSQDAFDNFTLNVKNVLWAKGCRIYDLNDVARLLLIIAINDLSLLSRDELDKICRNFPVIKSEEVVFDDDFNAYFLNPEKGDYAKFPHIRRGKIGDPQPEIPEDAPARLNMINPSWDKLAAQVEALNDLAREISEKFDALSNGDKQ